MQSPTDIEDSTEHDDDQRGDEHWRQDPDGRWRLDPEERKRRLQAAMEQGAADRLARAWDLVREAKREIDIALTYARDPELHKIGVGLGALLDEDTRDKSYAYVNKLVRGGTTTRRQHGTAKRDGELLLGAIRSKWDGSDEEMARFVIGIMPDLGLLPAPAFVFNHADVPRIASVISKFERTPRLSNLRAPERARLAKIERRIARAILKEYGATNADLKHLFD